MLRLAYANHAEGLARALIDRIAELRARPDRSPLTPIDLLVPNRATQSWLKIELARTTGIAANLRFDFLERALARAIEGDPHAPRPRAKSGEARPKLRVAGTDVLRSTILAALGDPSVLDRAELAPVRAYLDAGTDDDAQDLRRFQLASELARLFGEYQVTRRDVVRAWRQRTTIEDGPRAVVERWQRALWLEVEARLRAASTAERRILTLPDAFEVTPPFELFVPDELHVFALRVVTPVELSMIARIAARANVFVYALNPVRQIWDLGEAGDTPALRLWGRAGREGVRLLNELTEGDFDDRFDERDPGRERTLLETLQLDVLDRHPERGPADREARFTGDPSITFFECPGPRREIEAIAEEIWALVRRSEVEHRETGTPPLRFNQIAVVLAGRDVDVLRAHVGAVFQEHHGVPHHYLDVPVHASSRVVEALSLLLALPFSAFTRQDLLELVLHPNVAAQLGDVDPTEWLRWLDALSVVHGADRADHAGTYIEKDLYNWDQGLRRLVLGAFVPGEASGELGAVEAKDARGEPALYLPEEVPLDRLGAAAKLVVLVRSLVADARWLRTTKLPLPEWARVIAQLCTTYVGRPTDEDERDVRNVLSAIHDLEKLDTSGEPVSFRIASELVRSALSRLTTNRGQPLADGVTVAPLAAVSFLPFDVVFVAGLGEGRFPASERRSQLDLRSEEKRIGDVSPRDEDEYLFLERLLATRERVYLSWVSRDARTGDPLEPSTIVLELRHLLERGYVDAVHEVRHPLRRYERDGSSETELVLSPAARGEQGARALRAHLLETLGVEGAKVPELPELRTALDGTVWEPLARRLGLCPIPGPRAEASEGTETVRVPQSALRRFLEDPAEGWLRYVLGMRESDSLEDPVAREDEAFATSALHASIFLREILAEKLAHDATTGERTPFARFYDARADRLELKGVRPTGVFGHAERDRHLGILERWARHVVEACGVGAKLSPPLRYGPAQETTTAIELLDPLVIEVELPGKKVTVELSGRTELSVAADLGAGMRGYETSVVPFMREKPGSLRREKDALRTFVDHAVLAALGRVEAARRALVLYGDGDHQLVFRPFTREDATAWLRTILADLLGEPHAYELSFERVLTVHGAERSWRPDDAPIRRRASLPDLRVLAPEREAEVIERRFGAYFARREGGGS